MTEFGADEIRDFTKLKRLREAGYFESEGSVPMPEIVADGGEGALQDLLSARSHHARTYAHTNMFCTNCDRMTQHGQVATYENTGQPVFHCNFCCKCHPCLERHGGAQRLYNAVNNEPAAWERPVADTDDHTFCIDCGALLRCSVCESTGPGNYCRDCGQKIEVTGPCPSCGEGLAT